MFPSSFFDNIKKKIVPDILEVIFSLRTELEAQTNRLSERLDKLESQIEMLVKDQHPPTVDIEEFEEMKAVIKKIKNKKVFKSLNAK